MWTKAIALFPVLFLVSSLGVITAGCTDTGTQETSQSLPIINEFTATPDSISPGETASLCWSVSNASTVSIDQEIGNVSLNGNRSVRPEKSTIYTLTATGEGGSNTATIQVMVTSSAPSATSTPPETPSQLTVLPIINSFTVDPIKITAGNSATLSWNISNASSVIISPGIGKVPNTGNSKISPAETTEYILTAVNGDHVKTRSVSIQVSNVSGVAHIGWLEGVKYDFIEQASSAAWNTLGVVADQPFPGSTDDSDGFACYQLNKKMNDGTTYERLLITHPRWVDDGYIKGTYRNIDVPAGTKFKVKAGLIGGATSGKVRFRVFCSAEDYSFHNLIWEQVIAYADGVKTAEVNLSAFVGEDRIFTFYVDTQGTSKQDWAAWAEAQIVD
jgi:hypothetical protein